MTHAVHSYSSHRRVTRVELEEFGGNIQIFTVLSLVAGERNVIMENVGVSKASAALTRRSIV